jgi:hypothetical protein
MSLFANPTLPQVIILVLSIVAIIAVIAVLFGMWWRRYTVEGRKDAAGDVYGCGGGVFGGGMEGRELGGFVCVLAFLYGGIVLRLWDSCCFFCSYDLFICVYLI